jgi:hypothetical protein
VYLLTLEHHRRLLHPLLQANLLRRSRHQVLPMPTSGVRGNPLALLVLVLAMKIYGARGNL